MVPVMPISPITENEACMTSFCGGVFQTASSTLVMLFGASPGNTEYAPMQLSSDLREHTSLSPRGFTAAPPPAGSNGGGRRCAAPRSLPGFLELQEELVHGHRRLEHRDVALVGGIAREVARADEAEAGGLGVGAHHALLDAVHR